MNGVEGVPLKMLLGALQEEVELITAPEITIPNYLDILRDTEYEFSLEKWVLTGLQRGYPSQPRPRGPCSASELLPSCPPYWQMFSSPQQSRLASRYSSDFWEPNPRQRSHSLDPADLLSAKLKHNISDSENEGEGALEKATGRGKTPVKSPLVRQESERKVQRAFTPDLLNPPACLSSLPHQCRKNLRQCSLSVLEIPSGEKQNNFSPCQPKTPHRPPNTRANTANSVPNIKNHKPTHLVRDGFRRENRVTPNLVLGLGELKVYNALEKATGRGKTPVKSPLVRQESDRKVQRAFTPDLLNPPACLSSLPHQCRKNLRQCSLSVLEIPSGEKQNNFSPCQPKTPHRPPNTRANTVNSVPNTKNHKPTHLSHSLNISLPPPPSVTSRSLGSLGASLDTSVELLSALSPEERELLEAITEHGYPLRTAILALQKTGQQTPEKILSYLMACDHLCELGYDEAQVEEALEMFQNCETKAEEFLHLLGQFNEMGFQQNTIKEVLLIHENHRERALEELMMRVA